MNTRTTHAIRGGVRRKRLVSGACFGALLAGLLGLAGLSPAHAAAAAWAVVPSPSKGTSNNLLNDVSCASSSSCTAVGYYTTSTGLRTLAESWNGTTWSIKPSPNQGTGSNQLNGVACASSSSCTAVGTYTNSSTGSSQTLAESWNGTTWSIKPSPNQGTSNNVLNGVSCTSSSSCTAVGNYTNISTGSFRTLAESWNGTNWTIKLSPNKLTSYNSLQGVSCPSSSLCTAVGTGANTSQTLVESWNGTKWSIVPSPSKGSVNYLSGVSCASSSSCAAAGFYASSAAARTLIERS